MTALLLILLKAQLAACAIALVGCFCRWQDVRGIAFPSAAVLILCGAIRVML